MRPAVAALLVVNGLLGCGLGGHLGGFGGASGTGGTASAGGHMGGGSGGTGNGGPGGSSPVGCYTTGAGGRSGPAVDAAAVLALANCLPVGTGGAPEQVGDASPAQDATSVIDGSWYIDGGQCIVPLDALGCAPTLEHAGDSACAVCKGWARGCPVVVTCANNRLQYEESSPAGGRTCSYDATTHALIGGATNAFTNGFCEGLTGYAGEQGCDYAYDATSYPSPYCP